MVYIQTVHKYKLVGPNPIFMPKGFSGSESSQSNYVPS